MKASFLVSVLVTVFCGTAQAALVIDYTGKDQSSASYGNVTEPTKKVLLLDQSVQWAEIIGLEKCGKNLSVTGSGIDVPLSMALRMLTPQGWKVYADDDIPLETSLVTWRTGVTWTKVIADAAEANKFKVVINCEKNEMSLKGAPNLGILADDEIRSGDRIGKLPESEMIPQIAPQNTQAESIPAVGAVTTNSRNITEPVPFNGESAGAFFSRYAEAYGYDRVAYRLKGIKVDSLLRKKVSEGKNKETLASFLRINNLLQINGLDAVTNTSVMIITNDPAAQGRGDLLVYPVGVGMLSENAIQMAKAIGWSIGGANIWPLDVDYKVPYGFDIVLLEPVDGFEQIFGSYPIQAQLIIGSKVVNVVKRNTANRKSL